MKYGLILCERNFSVGIFLLFLFNIYNKERERERKLYSVSRKMSRVIKLISIKAIEFLQIGG